jgi:zinc protease
MNKVKEYLVKQYHQAAITNDYWDYVLYNEIRNGVDFDSNYPEMVEAVTAADIQQMAVDILKSNRRIEITMHSAQ